MKVLLVCALLLQDKTAEETYKRIEDMILNAKTVSVKFRFVIDQKRTDTALRIEGPGTILLKGEDKLRITFKYPEGGDDKEYDAVAEGEKGLVRFEGKIGDWRIEKGTHRRFRAMLVRGGILGPNQPWPIPWCLVASSVGFENWKVSEVKQGPDEGKAKTLTYHLRLEKQETPIELKLWYDAESLKPLKRMYRFKAGQPFTESEGTFTETYEELILNADIPDEKFKLANK
jgi:outer membrane lipoprotein-sorting protein